MDKASHFGDKTMLLTADMVWSYMETYTKKKQTTMSKQCIQSNFNAIFSVRNLKNRPIFHPHPLSLDYFIAVVLAHKKTEVIMRKTLWSIPGATFLFQYIKVICPKQLATDVNNYIHSREDYEFNKFAMQIVMVVKSQKSHGLYFIYCPQ